MVQWDNELERHIQRLQLPRGPINPPYVSRMYPRVVRTYKTTNHLKHIVLGGLLSGGLWWFTGYPLCVLLNRRVRTRSVLR